MSQDVTQWVAEVRSLQRQIAELQQESDQAYASADNWRNLYEAEAQQRRREAATAASKIERLQQDIAELQFLASADLGATTMPDTDAQQRLSVEQLQAQLADAKKQHFQLKAMLTAEQTQHAQTRESLTAALGDAVDLLAKERLTGRDA
ncbi:hypothetical protein [Leptolyngbya sp. BC1307]|uniref:hypothetical protein n=1 Tax=Leptolyngbya sp. BC1307 TaxID=2029589 RepID=UPI000EFA7339|nr:hypothetical protein [Leptolyngbya sp. BC1307]